jgi:predicted DNA-binding transcriptional regulator AlpA
MPDEPNALIFESPRQTCKACDFSMSTFWRRVKTDPDFPKPVYVSPKMPRIIKGEREAYQRKLMAERDAEAVE